MNSFPPTTLAIDFGTKRIGLAISRASLAEPLTIISAQDQRRAIEQIQTICQREQVRQIVLGLSENEMALKTRAFGEVLQEQLQLPVHFVDETLSSKTVLDKTTRHRKKNVRSGKPIDDLAAAEFLQEWLD